jgi:HTH-type transcriptional regulator/antitoxin HigA
MIVTDSVLAPWAAVNTSLGLSSPVRDEAHYTELLAFVDECFERFGAQDNHPIFALVDIVAQRIKAYEDQLHPWPDASKPATPLAFLMDQHGLRQCDLSEVGAQSVVSDVLSGKRKLNRRQTQALARRFGVPVDAMI